MDEFKDGLEKLNSTSFISDYYFYMRLCPIGPTLHKFINAFFMLGVGDRSAE